MSKIQAKEGEFIMEGEINDSIQKIVGQGKFRRIVNKTPQEIETDNPSPPEISESQRPAYITNKQWQDVLKRLKKLEKDVSK